MAIDQVALHDMDEWTEFARENEEALVAQYGSIDNALKHCCDGGLRMGGGAQPIVDIFFAEPT